MRYAQKCLSLLRWDISLFLFLLSSAAWAGYDSNAIWNSKTKVQVLKTESGAYGFTVLAGDKKVCDIELSTGKRWLAKYARTAQDKERVWLELKDIDTTGTKGTPGLGPDSYIRVSLNGEKPYPVVEFSLDLKSFNANAWRQALTPDAPFYYLRCTPPGATIVVHGGTLIPTPKIEKYPLTRKGVMAGEWSDGWSYAPAMAGWAVPAIGLWDHERGTFVCYDFNLARLTDRSEKYIAGAYCCGIGDHRGEFFALVHPYQAKWTRLAYPEKPEVIHSKFELLYSFEIPSYKDPNQFILNYLYTEHQDLLPPVPRMNDLGWINKPDGLTPPFGIPRTNAGAGVIWKSGPAGLEGAFVEQGSEMLGNDFISDGIRRAYSQKNKAEIINVKKQLDYLMKNTTWIQIDGETCCAWMHPLTGSFKKQWGGDEVRGVHHPSTFQIGTAMLVVYANEGDGKYLPCIDGVYNWVKHFLYTRNGVCDLPWAMFCRAGTAAGENFLLNYRQVFKNDPVRSKNYEEAIQLALMTLYKVMWFYTTNPDETNNLDPTFLNQAVNDKNWIGRVTWNECGWVVRSMVPIYCETADPFLKYILRGCLERYWMGYRDDGGIAENVQIFGEIEKRGLRTGGFSDIQHGANVRRYALPVGNAPVRVCVGEKAAIAFCRDTLDFDIEDYCYESGDNFSFKLISLRPDKKQNSIDIIATFPFRDLRSKKVYLNGKELPPDRYEFNNATDGEDVYIWDVMPGDMVQVGEIKNAKTFVQPEIKYRKPLNGPVKIYGFECLNLYPFCNAGLELRFEKPGNWFGFIPGMHFKNSVPFYLVDPSLNRDLCVVKGNSRNPAGIDVKKNAKTVFLFFGVQKQDYKKEKATGKAIIYFRDGTNITAEAIKVLPADITNLMPLRTWDLYMYPVFFESEKEVEKISVQDGILFAATVASNEVPDKVIAGIKEKIIESEIAKKEELSHQEKLKKGTALLLKSEYSAANTYEYTYLFVVDDEFEIPENSFLEYDMFIPLDSASFTGGVDLVGGTLGNLRDKQVSDDKGGAHPGSAPAGAKGNWCHRKIPLKGFAGETFNKVVIAVDGMEHKKGTYRAFFKDIQITDGREKILIDLFTNKKEIPCEVGVAELKDMTDYSVEVVPVSEVKNPEPKTEVSVSIKEPEGIINPDFSFEKQGEYWTFWGEARFFTDEAHSGKVCVELSIPDGGLALVMTNYAGSMKLGVKPRKIYRVSFWAKCLSEKGNIMTNFYDNNYDFKQISVPLIADGEWHRYEVEVPAGDFPVAETRARVFTCIPPVLPGLRFWVLQKAQSVLLDDVEVREK